MGLHLILHIVRSREVGYEKVTDIVNPKCMVHAQVGTQFKRERKELTFFICRHPYPKNGKTMSSSLCSYISAIYWPIGILKKTGIYVKGAFL